MERELLATVPGTIAETIVLRSCYEETPKQGDSLEKEIMQGTLPGSRARGRPRMTWNDKIRTWTCLSTSDWRKTEDRDKWISFARCAANPRSEDGWRQGKIQCSNYWQLTSYLLNCLFIVSVVLFVCLDRRYECVLPGNFAGDRSRYSLLLGCTHGYVGSAADWQTAVQGGTKCICTTTANHNNLLNILALCELYCSCSQTFTCSSLKLPHSSLNWLMYC